MPHTKHLLKKTTLTNDLLSLKLKEVSQLLHQERLNNTQLNIELSKTVEKMLHLQIEMQELKARSIQSHVLDRKELIQNYEHIQSQSLIEKEELIKKIDELNYELINKDRVIESLNQKNYLCQTSLKEIDSTHKVEINNLKAIISKLEDSITDHKLDNENLNIANSDLISHLHQVSTNFDVLKKENISLKNYINEMTKIQHNIQQFTQNTNITTISSKPVIKNY